MSSFLGRGDHDGPFQIEVLHALSQPAHIRGNRRAIFYHGDPQKKLAEDSTHAIETTPQRFKGKIVTEIMPTAVFYPTEGYHQDFYKKDPERYESYRRGCGRDRRLQQLWGAPGRHGRS